MAEILDIVDEKGNPTGETASRSDAHRLGLPHRTSHVWLARRRNGRVQLLLQKRSENKDSFPGCFDISSAGHIPAGEDFIGSALRELREELGVDAAPERLIFCGQRRFTFEAVFYGKDFKDNQVSNVYLLWEDRAAEAFRIQKEELSEVLWMDFEDCLKMVETDSAPNCIYLEELKMVGKAIAAEN